MKIVLLCFLFGIVSTILEFFDDLLIGKNIFFRGSRYEAEVTGLDTVGIWKTIFSITLVKYKRGESQVNTYIRSSTKDKIGDKILIVTDGYIAVRKRMYWKKDFSFGTLIYNLFMLLVFGWASYRWIDLFTIYDIMLYVIIILIFLIFYPHIYKNQVDSIRKKIGYLG